jgi:hypothetical protein
MDGRKVLTGLLLSILAASNLPAEDTDFSISKNIPDRNRHPRIAMAANGNVLVVWSSGPYLTYVDAAHYTALCMAKSGGNYKVKKARTLADSDRSINSYNLAFNSEDNSWVVVWSENDSSASSDDFSAINSQKISKTGRFNGPRNVIIEDKNADDHDPVIAYLPSSGSSTPAAKGGYLLVWDSYRPLDLKNSGLYSVHLDENGLPVPSELRHVRKSNDVDGYASFFENCELLRTSNGKYVVAGHSYELRSGGEQEAVYYPMLLRLSSSGGFEKQLLPDSPESQYVRAGQVSSKYLLVYWLTFEDVRCCLVKTKNFKNNKVIIQEEHPLSYARDGKIVGFENQPGALYIFCDDKMIFALRYDQNGRPGGEPMTILESEGYIDSLNAACIPGTNDIFIAYAVEPEIGNDYEMRGRVIKGSELAAVQ